MNGHRYIVICILDYIHYPGVGQMAIVLKLDFSTTASMASMMQDPSLGQNVKIKDNCYLSNPGWCSPRYK